MNTFKQSTIEILEKAGTPLHYTKITRLTLKFGILKTISDKNNLETISPSFTSNLVTQTDSNHSLTGYLN